MEKDYLPGYHHSAIAPGVPPVVTPQFLSARTTESKEFRATWLGHACFYVEFPGGLRALFDPVFSQRCSPVQFMGPKRVTRMPCEIEDIPAIDIVVISHNHYDHMDYNTIMKLTKCHPNVWFFVPLGNKPWYAFPPMILRQRQIELGEVENQLTMRFVWVGSPARVSQTVPKWIGGKNATWCFLQLGPSLRKMHRDLPNLEALIRR